MVLPQWLVLTQVEIDAMIPSLDASNEGSHFMNKTTCELNYWTGTELKVIAFVVPA